MSRCGRRDVHEVDEDRRDEGARLCLGARGVGGPSAGLLGGLALRALRALRALAARHLHAPDLVDAQRVGLTVLTGEGLDRARREVQERALVGARLARAL